MLTFPQIMKAEQDFNELKEKVERLEFMIDVLNGSLLELVDEVNILRGEMEDKHNAD